MFSSFFRKKPSGEEAGSLARRRLRKTRRILLTVFTIAAVAAAGYFTMILVSPTEVNIGPVRVEFSLKPAWHGSSQVDLPPAGSLEADTHSGPMQVDYELKQISVENLSDLTDPNSQARQALDNWQGPVHQEARSLILRIIIATALAGAVTAGLIRRRWQWGVAGAGLAMLVALSVSGVAYATYNTGAFSEPHYQGGLSYAPQVVAFSQQTLANLDKYENQVPQIAQSLYATVNALHDLPAAADPDTDTIRVLHISDMHSSAAGANLVKKVMDLYHIDFVIDTGDQTELGTPFEAGYPSTYLPLAKPYVWTAGNHDTPTIINAMKGIKGVTVLDNQFTMVDGVVIGGFPDPASTSLSPDPVSDARMKQVAQGIVGTVDGHTPEPFIVAVHDPREAAGLPGKVPVVVNGHTHHEDVSIKNGTVFLDAGSTGGGGLRSFNGQGESPSSLQVLYISRNPLKLEAVDSIVIYGFSQEFSVTRHVFGPGEGAMVGTGAGEQGVGTAAAPAETAGSTVPTG